jgi:hypothetical protein
MSVFEFYKRKSSGLMNYMEIMEWNVVIGDEETGPPNGSW